MLSLSWQLYRIRLNRQEAMPRDRSKFYEVIAILLVILSPFLVNWIPFVLGDHGMYGQSGLVCWIKTVSNDTCIDDKLNHLSDALLLIMFYCPTFFIVAFGMVCMISIIVLLYRASKHIHGGIRQRYQHSMKEIAMLFIYHLIYCLLCFVMLITDVYSKIEGHLDHSMWIVHAVASSLRHVVPGLAFVLHPYVWRNVHSRLVASRDVASAHTRYSVPPEDDDIDEGITIRPAGDQYGSFKRSLLFNKTINLSL